MAKAFLSHSSSDKPLVEKIAFQLGKNNCIYDSMTFEVGQETLIEIFKGLDVTDVFVLFISDNALNSSWVQDEISNTKTRFEDHVIERIFPIIIDRSITFNDKRIPDWIKKPYNIRYFHNEVLILKKIQQILREVNLNRYAHLQSINDLFVGRHELLAEFERKMFTLDNIKPSTLIAYSAFNGIGRRTFLKNALVKSRIIHKLYEPIQIPMDVRESIEDFIYKLSFVEPKNEIFQLDLPNETLEAKIEMATRLLKAFIDANELIFIIDEGGIILPNTKIVPWFAEIAKADAFKNQVSICLISKFKPDAIQLRRIGNVAAFQINELSSLEGQTLFVQFLDRLSIEIERRDIEFFIDYFYGIPAQIISTGKLIHSAGITDAKHHIGELEEFDHENSVAILEHLRDEQTCLEMLIAFSKMEIVSYDLIYQIFGEEEETYRSIQRIFDMGLLYNISSTHEYLKLNSSLANYINRAELRSSEIVEHRLKNILKNSLSKPLELKDSSDYSEFLLTIQNMIANGVAVPSKYLLPSYILKSMVHQYYESKYKSVIKLANQILQNQRKFDKQVIRETRYWLCLAYCRENDERFFEEVSLGKEEDLFTLNDYHFLLGFYYRLAKRPAKAEEHFLKVLDYDKDNPKTKRELVTVYLQKEEYEKALSFARDNFNGRKHNILNVDAYFTALINKKDIDDNDVDILQDLMQRARDSKDSRASEFYEIMQANFAFYVNGDTEVAMDKLEQMRQLQKKNVHVSKSLGRMYKKLGLSQKVDKLFEGFEEDKHVDAEHF